MAKTVKLNRNCDMTGCNQHAIADVKLQASLGGQWAYVCETHYSLRYGDVFVTKLERH